MAARTRLFKELKEASRAGDASGVSLSVSDDNIFAWTAVVAGPPGTPYEGGAFVLSLDVPPAYPMAPPAARFRTRVFHPNVHPKTGEVCLDVLKAAWSPAWTLAALCHAVRALLADAAPDSPLNCDAGNLLRAGDARGYAALARMYTLEHACGGGVGAGGAGGGGGPGEGGAGAGGSGAGGGAERRAW